MYLYEAISCRHTVRRYLDRKVPEEVRNQILRFFDSADRLDESLAVEAVITDRGEKQKNGKKRRHEGSAPHLLVLYSAPGDLAEKNAGYILQQVALYLVCKGIGSRMLGGEKPEKIVRNGKRAVIGMEFGYPDEPLLRESPLASRLPLRKLCLTDGEIDENMRTILRAARLAPSAWNSQPWRFAVSGMKLRVYERVTFAGYLAGKRCRDISFGCMLAHIAIAADELWLHEKITYESRPAGKEKKKLSLLMTITFTT